MVPDIVEIGEGDLSPHRHDQHERRELQIALGDLIVAADRAIATLAARRIDVTARPFATPARRIRTCTTRSPAAAGEAARARTPRAERSACIVRLCARQVKIP